VNDDAAKDGAAGRRTPFASGVAWNFASLAFLASTGVVLNVVIGRLYGPNDLGVFNICFAVFIFLSQFGAFGLQFSVLQSVAAREKEGREEVDEIVSAGLAAVVATSSAATLAGLALTPFLPLVFDAPRISEAFLVMLPGLWFFSINKYLFGVVNGARHMRVFAALQSMRYALMLLALATLAVMKAPGHLLTAVFTAAEALNAPALFYYASRAVGRWRAPRRRLWVDRHLSYGARSFMSGAILELNTRVDVLIIGALIGPAKAGVYSAALLVAEGMAQAIFALRNSVNPLIARMVAAGARRALLAFSRRLALAFTLFMAAASMVAILVYPFYIRWAMGGGAFHESRASAVILLVALTASAGAQCFGMILAMAGRPALHTAYVASVLAANVVFNFALVPLLGIEGSALATGLSYLVAGAGVVLLSRRALGLRIIL
jgi:O-antigen/teichoic acid export membrane protein